MWLLGLLSLALAGDLHDQGVELRTAGDLASATAVLRQAVEDDPEDTDTWLDLAVTQAWDGETSDALQSLEQALQIDPTHLGSLAFQARVLSWDGQYKASDRSWESLRDSHPNDPNIWSGTGDLHRTCGALAKARQAYDTALGLDPTHGEATAGQRALTQQSSVRLSGWAGMTIGAGASGGAMVEARLGCALRGTAAVSVPAPTDSAASWAKGVRTDLSITRSAPERPTLGAQASVSASALRVTGFMAQGSGRIRWGGQTGLGLVRDQSPTWLLGPTVDIQLARKSWSRLSVVTGINPNGVDDVIGVASMGVAEQFRMDLATRWSAETPLSSLSVSARSPATPAGQATLSVQTTLTQAPAVTINVGWVIGQAP